MILTEFTINGSVNRISLRGHRLTNAWPARIVGMDNVIWACRSNRGGYCPLSYGRIQTYPELWADNYPPPDDGAITVKYTNENEEDAITLIDAMAYCAGLADDAVTHLLLPAGYDETLADASLSTDTLANVLEDILTGITGISTLDTTQARSPSPQVVPADYAGRLNIDYASELAEAMCHLFYIQGATAYLVDMLGENGSRIITEHQADQAIRIERGAPIAEIRHDDPDNPYPRQSSFPYGRQ